MEQVGLIVINNAEALQYFSNQFPTIALKVNEIIFGTYSTESKRQALKCLEAWITFSPTQLTTELLNTLIKALYDFTLLDEVASCISKCLEFTMFTSREPPPSSLCSFVKTVINYLYQENIIQLIKLNIGLVAVIKAISENYTCILNKVIYECKLIGRR